MARPNQPPSTPGSGGPPIRAACSAACFGVRALALTGQLSEAAGASYLSGVLIGHEARAALADAPPATVVHIIGAPELTALYARAIEACGGMAERLNGEAAARGLALIGEHAQWHWPTGCAAAA